MRCEFPKVVRGKIVPCNRCVACRHARAKDIEARFWCEKELIDVGGLFICLTYNPDFLPDDCCVHKSEISEYMNRINCRLRKAGIPIPKYTACGEYGERFFRPHYHLVVIGVEPTQEMIEIFTHAWRDYKGGSIVHIKPLRRGISGIRYVTGYITKSSRFKLKPGETVEQFKERTGRTPEFLTMSKGFGLGYIKHNLDNLVNVGYLQFGNLKFSFPRYFLKKFDELATREQFEVLLTKHREFLVDKCSEKPVEQSVGIVSTLKNIEMDHLVDATFTYQSALRDFGAIFRQTWKEFREKYENEKITDNEYYNQLAGSLSKRKGCTVSEYSTSLPPNLQYSWFSALKKLCFNDLPTYIGKYVDFRRRERQHPIHLLPEIPTFGVQFPHGFYSLDVTSDYEAFLVVRDFAETVHERFFCCDSFLRLTHICFDPLYSKYRDSIVSWNKCLDQVRELFLEESKQSALNLRRQLEVKYNVML